MKKGNEIEQEKGKKAMTTVVGIVEGCGSMGAAIGQFVIGLLVRFGWKTVFFALTMAVILAGISNGGIYLKKLRQAADKISVFSTVNNKPQAI